MRVVVAPDKFKGSLTAAQVAARVAAGLVRAAPGVDAIQVPVADGGDGTLEAALSAGYRRVPVRAEGPTGEPVDTAYAERDGVAVVELADVSGSGGSRRRLAAVPPPLRHRPGGRGRPRRRLPPGLLGIGGSACTTAGRPGPGAGGRLADGGGAEVGRARALAAVRSLDLSGMHQALGRPRSSWPARRQPVAGAPRGGGRLRTPEGGVSGRRRELDAALARWAGTVQRATGTDLAGAPGAGAAGGVGFAALAVLGARLQPGIDLVLDLVRFRERLPGRGW